MVGGFATCLLLYAAVRRGEITSRNSMWFLVGRMDIINVKISAWLGTTTPTEVVLISWMELMIKMLYFEGM